MTVPMTGADREEVAIIGMAGRFPGARDIHELWSLLHTGGCAIGPFEPAELAASGVAGGDPADPYFVNAGAVMAEPDGFDAEFFGMSPREAELTDPQHRVFLECAWEALEHAGCDPASFPGRIALYGGVAANTYFIHNISTDREMMRRVGAYPLLIATEREYAVTRTAFKLGLRGPAVTVGTACSTSAVAVHLAAASLLSGEAELALAGGVRVRVPLTSGYVYEEGGILSPDGSCRAFDADACGTVAASGAAFVVLKRLSDALEDRDTVYALLKGSAINNDGQDKVGYTAPSVRGQAAVIAEALALAEVSADSIDYVEAHGTGTPVGDPIEVAALTQAFRLETTREAYCRLGSVKTNLGHLDAAAGVAGLIKTVLAMRAGVIPASLGFRTPNPQLNLLRSPFVVNDRLTGWPRHDGRPRRAGVSSFGLGGTNAHLVLEEAPEQRSDESSHDSEPLDEVELVVISARSPGALEHASQRLATFLARQPDLELGDVAHTLQVGRRHLPHRRAVVATSTDGALAALAAASTDAGDPAGDEPRVAFLFPGGGSQHVDMARGLYRREGVFREALDECAELMSSSGRDLLNLLFPSADGRSDAARRLRDVRDGLPALFAVEHSLARWWESRGVEPVAMLGHSAGEFVAACLSGVFSLTDALTVVQTRSDLMQAAPSGRMLSVALGEREVAGYLSDAVTLAVVNGPDACVLAGTEADVEALERRLADDQVDASRVRVEVASHSPLMDSVVAPLVECVRRLSPKQPTIPFVSNMTGTWITDEQAVNPEYWGQQLRSTARFADGLRHILEASDVQVEVGPGRVLSSYTRAVLQTAGSACPVASMRHPDDQRDDREVLYAAVGAVWTVGVTPNWAAMRAGRRRRRVGLPTYPFEHKRYWIGPINSAAAPANAPEVRSAPASSHDVTADSPSRLAETQQVAELPSRTTEATPADSKPRHDRIAAGVVNILSELSGRRTEDIDRATPFSDLGFDSLFLTQANTAFRKTYGVRITFRQLFEEAPTVTSLAAFIDERLPADAVAGEPKSEPVGPPDPALDAVPEKQPSVGPDESPSVTNETASRSALQRVVAQQLTVMAAQLDLMRGAEGSPSAAVLHSPAGQVSTSHVPVTVTPHPPRVESGKHRVAPKGVPDDRQQRAITDLVNRYGAMTPRSRELADRWRPQLADNRTIVGFDREWKDLVYQIVSERSAGPLIWDVDGNQYVDTALSFGAALLGHSPEAVTSAVQAQLRRGFAVGVQSDLLGEVTADILAMTGHERLTYCHSGGEAVETAIRISRTATARDKVAYFTDDIHGRSDIVLGRNIGSGGSTRTVPLVAGVPQHVVDDALVLSYGSAEALDAIRAAGHELAAVLVEPVRTRNPDLQPQQFLRDVREIADRAGFLLIFDEVVTGFRTHQRGVQGLWSIHADLTTYGKALGGGLPIGVVAGAASFIDAIDGGPWRFGDHSYPSADVTGAGGTMIKHALSLAAARAVLEHLRDAGPVLQERLTATTLELVEDLNAYYHRHGIALHIQHFGSFFRPTFTAHNRFEGLFQYFLREQGVHTNPPSPSFLSTAHAPADVDRVAAAYRRAGAEMARLGLLDPPGPRVTSSPAVAPDRSGADTDELQVPLLPNVMRFLIERGSSHDLHHWNVGGLLESTEPLDPDALRSALREVVLRHDAFRLRYVHDSGVWRALVAADVADVPLSVHDLSGLAESEQLAALRRVCEETQSSFDLSRSPLLRMVLVELGTRGQRLLVVMHHLVMDGLSWRPFWDDFLAAYCRARDRQPVVLPLASSSFADWAETLSRHASSGAVASDLKRWLSLPWDRVRRLPQDVAGSEAENVNGSAGAVTVCLTRAETDQLLFGTPRVRQKVDLMITALAQVLSGWTDADTVLIDMMGHGRDEDLSDDIDLFGTIGFFISYTPMVLRLGTLDGSHLLSEQIHAALRRGLSFDVLRTMSPDVDARAAIESLPKAQVLFNYLGRRSRLDTVPDSALLRDAPQDAGPSHGGRGRRYYPLSVSAEVWEDSLRATFVYSGNLHERSTIKSLGGQFKVALTGLVEQHGELAS